MEKKDIYNCPKCAGIYLLRNKINNKCFIGQFIKLQKGVKSLIRDYKSDKYPYTALYKAMREYGIENFELTILKTFGDSLAWRTKNQLDLHEKKYIEQYDSHNNGYNVLIEPPNNQDYNTIQELNSGLKAISLRTKEVVFGNSEEELSTKLNIPKYTILKCLNKAQKIASKEWVICRYNEDFPEYSTYDSDEIKDILNNQFKELSTRDNIADYIINNPQCSYGEISQNYTLSKKTFFEYKMRLKDN